MPLGIFSALLILSVILLVIAIRAGGAARALSLAGIGWSRAEALRFTALAVILFFYIAGLVPRVDFIASSGLPITAMIFGFYGGHARRMVLAASLVGVCGAYAMITHLPQAEWALHDDDIVTLVAPVVLVCAMAFGFRQNIPNRGGIIFEQIQYHYYVTLRPLWRS